ncbi:MAG: metal-dependent hydrolase [Microcoleus sp. PH2017_15_JOR_U_A]|jgi:inner membrane protein|uniref:metal-dependent hydrolase n=1 Tax=Microcoleus sp. PH2017_15_JOR_U_A TaxID=2798826 RepID=UPI001DA9DCD2|nr:metal-dependent hydrolase [Microcoleus sp. PH2017_15_JOR_U_A]MCC3498362.1 metal-dependent hydrolase [Microcoleus sp. PH2017_15_JOR_U_A]MCC3509546.1 metal-dependent hydrolase [Microcoleus sp. PH2017_17_BER_D_A]
MMALTHSIIAAAGVSLTLTTANPLHLALAIGGSQLPDLDTSTSTIGQILFPISNWIENRFPHRSITHCFLATCVIALLSAPLYFYFDWKTWLCLPLGHILSCFSDVFTKQGVQFFWPHPAWCISVSNPNKRLQTGGTGEYWVLAIAMITFVAAINLSSTGGPTALVGTSLGLRTNATETYQKNAATNHVYAQVTGTFSSDSSSADGKYFKIAGEGNEFVLMNKMGVFKTGTNIIASRLTSEVGKPASASVQTLNFDEEEFAVAPIPNALVFLTGALTVDEPQLIKIPINPKQLEIAKLTGTQLNLSYCPLETAIKLLSGQYITGSLEAKIFTPKPEL